MRGRRGSALVLCLLLVVTLFIMGMGFLSQHTSGRLASRRAVLAAQARELARAGLENARAKLNCDLKFPPRGEAGESYVYCETLQDIGQGVPVGSYEVTLDMDLMAPPYEILKVESLGWVGTRQLPEAYHRLSAEIDVATRDRGNPALTNPRLGQWLNFWDQGGP